MNKRTAAELGQYVLRETPEFPQLDEDYTQEHLCTLTDVEITHSSISVSVLQTTFNAHANVVLTQHNLCTLCGNNIVMVSAALRFRIKYIHCINKSVVQTEPICSCVMLLFCVWK